MNKTEQSSEIILQIDIVNQFLTSSEEIQQRMDSLKDTGITE